MEDGKTHWVETCASFPHGVGGTFPLEVPCVSCLHEEGDMSQWEASFWSSHGADDGTTLWVETSASFPYEEGGIPPLEHACVSSLHEEGHMSQTEAAFWPFHGVEDGKVHLVETCASYLHEEGGMIQMEASFWPSHHAEYGMA